MFKKESYAALKPLKTFALCAQDNFMKFAFNFILFFLCFDQHAFLALSQTFWGFAPYNIYLIIRVSAPMLLSKPPTGHLSIFNTVVVFLVLLRNNMLDISCLVDLI